MRFARVLAPVVALVVVAPHSAFAQEAPVPSWSETRPGLVSIQTPGCDGAIASVLTFAGIGAAGVGGGIGMMVAGISEGSNEGAGLALGGIPVIFASAGVGGGGAMAMGGGLDRCNAPLRLTELFGVSGVDFDIPHIGSGNPERIRLVHIDHLGFPADRARVLHEAFANDFDAHKFALIGYIEANAEELYRLTRSVVIETNDRASIRQLQSHAAAFRRHLEASGFSPESIEIFERIDQMIFSRLRSGVTNSPVDAVPPSAVISAEEGLLTIRF